TKWQTLSLLILPPMHYMLQITGRSALICGSVVAIHKRVDSSNLASCDCPGSLSLPSTTPRLSASDRAIALLDSDPLSEIEVTPALLTDKAPAETNCLW